jgi:hypothetical protein
MDEKILLFDNRRFGFKIKYLEDWQKVENYQNSNVMFIAPIKLNQNDNTNLRESITVSFQNLGGNNVTLEAYSERAVKELKVILRNFKLSSITNNTLENVPSKELLYSGVYQSVNCFRFMQNVIIKDNKAYGITYCSPHSLFDEGVKVARNLIKSFEII